jgi:K+-sensing histidine kinase KdpD
VWIRSPAELRQRYPAESSDGEGESGCYAAWAFLPLEPGGAAVGVLALAFAVQRDFSAHDRALLAAISEQCANALARGSRFRHVQARADALTASHALSTSRFRAAEQLVDDSEHLYQRARFERARTEAMAQATRPPAVVRTVRAAERNALRSTPPVVAERVDLGVLAARAIAQVATLELGADVALDVAGDVTLHGDPRRLTNAISKLVAHALRRAGSRDAVLVRVGTAHGAVVLDVHDRGEPIPRLAWDALFESADLRSATFATPTSAGSVLFLVREIVTGHGGTVSVESDEAHGTTFRVVLPRVPWLRLA